MGAPVCVTPPAELRAVPGLWLHCGQSLSSTRLSLGSENLSPLLGMASKAIVPHRESHQLRAHAMGGAGMDGAGNFSHRFVCLAGFLFKSKAVPSLGFLQCLPQEPVTAVLEYK